VPPILFFWVSLLLLVLMPSADIIGRIRFQAKRQRLLRDSMETIIAHFERELRLIFPCPSVRPEIRNVGS